jgi:hypothetical protein
MSEVMYYFIQDIVLLFFVKIGNQLEWEELPDSKMSRIRFQLNDVNIFEKEDWDKINSFFVDNLPRFESAFSNVIKQLK